MSEQQGTNAKWTSEPPEISTLKLFPTADGSVNYR